MATFHGFGRADRGTLTRDVTNASKRCMTVANALVYGPTPPTVRVLRLLQLTFGIDLRDWRDDEGWKKVEPIRSNFLSCRTDIGRCRFDFDASAPPKGTMDRDAYVVFGQGLRIHVRNGYFRSSVAPARLKPAKRRESTLVHEYIHIVYPRSNHPGGQPVVFSGPGALGIPYKDAVKNQYAYGYFYEWF